ncbi:Putative neuropeptide Y receptor 11 [Toxocara canis]|uniref:Putative neuropeptide Y receptor 11 n=1 Tax=Toxocara canis TaxID=6265 RepID=A0A0B2VJM4_TOXCA|nr:Putative neuropeptide Y receptor 11 [Toxocara canis]
MFEPWNQPHIATMLAVCERQRPQICLEKTWHRLPFSRRTYTLTVLTIQYLLPLAALAFGYSQIGSTIRRRVKASTTVDQQRRHIMMQRNRKALLLLLLLVLIYAIAWFPMNAYNVLNVLDVIEFSQYRYIFCHLVGMTSACMNPIMYGLLNDSFRSAFVSILRPFLRPCTKYTTVAAPPSHTYTFSLMGPQTIKPQIDELRKAMAVQNGADERSVLYNATNSDECKQNDAQF